MSTILKNTWKILTKKERRKFNTGIILNFLVSIIDIVSLAALLYIINFYTQTQKERVDNLLPPWLRDRTSLLLITIFFILFSAKNLAAFLISKSQFRFICGVANRLSLARLHSFFTGRYSDYIGVDSSIHIRKISYQPIEFCQYVLGSLQQVVIELMVVLLTVIAIVLYHPGLFLLLLIILLPPVTVVFFILKQRLRSATMQIKANSEKASQHLREALLSYVEANIYGKRAFFTSRYMTHQRQFHKHLAGSMLIQIMPHRVIEVFAVLGLFILIGVSRVAESGSSAFIIIGAYMAAAYKIIPGIVRIVNLSGQIKAHAFTIKNLLPEQCLAYKNDLIVQKIQFVECKNISFSFGGEQVLRRFNLSIEKGDFLGLCGRSGEGKTTVLNLLLGFLHPDNGGIFINHMQVDERMRQAYWPSISYIKQDTFLLHGTILHNITLEDDHDQKRLHTAIDASGLREFLDADPQGLHKIIKENGKNISGGQRQRIAIARALYKNADLIILDEPFNELDEAAETGLLEYFQQQAKKGKLIILITHNKQSLAFCNKIITVDERTTADAYYPDPGISKK